MENENKKRGIFRIFNIFDLVVLALALVLGAVLVISLLGGSDEQPVISTALNGGTVPVTYLVEFTVDEEERDIIKAGDAIVDKIQHYDLGTVESIEYQDAVRRVTDYESGRVVMASIPGQVTLHLTVSAKASVTETKILLDGGYIIKIGTGVNAMIQGVNLSGTVLRVELGVDK